MEIFPLKIFYIIILIFFIIGFYFESKARSNLSNEGDRHAVKLFLLGTRANKKYFNEIGKNYRRKTIITSFVLIGVLLLYLIFVIIYSNISAK